MAIKSRCELRKRKSGFIEIFRTTPSQTVCPNFYVLKHADGCQFQPQCSYCYLKSSFWYLPGAAAFTNVDDMIREVRRWIRREKLETYMLNMGNLSDSLTFERERPAIRRLVETFRECARGRPHSLLLVTKGGMEECRPLFELDPCANVVVSFSVNQAEAARRLERGAATTADRLKAAATLKKRGWRVRIRIDPMIRGYDYESLIGQVRRLRPERVTLGSLRAEHNLFKFAPTGIFKDLERPAEPKALARYPVKQRMALYHPAVEGLREICPIGLCEELRPVWEALGLDAESKPCNCCV